MKEPIRTTPDLPDAVRDALAEAEADFKDATAADVELIADDLYGKLQAICGWADEPTEGWESVWQTAQDATDWHRNRVAMQSHAQSA